MTSKLGLMFWCWLGSDKLITRHTSIFPSIHNDSQQCATIRTDHQLTRRDRSMVVQWKKAAGPNLFLSAINNAWPAINNRGSGAVVSQAFATARFDARQRRERQQRRLT